VATTTTRAARRPGRSSAAAASSAPEREDGVLGGAGQTLPALDQPARDPQNQHGVREVGAPRRSQRAAAVGHVIGYSTMPAVAAGTARAFADEPISPRPAVLEWPPGLHGTTTGFRARAATQPETVRSERTSGLAPGWRAVGGSHRTTVAARTVAAALDDPRRRASVCSLGDTLLAEHLPHFRRRDRDVDCDGAQVPERVDSRVGDGGGRADGRRFPTPLAPAVVR